MPIPSDARLASAPTAVLADVVYERLLALIVTGELAPGELVREVQVAEWLDVSRTPVREALRRLSAQGLLVYRPNRDSTVALMVADELRQIVEAMGALYGMAARLAVARFSGEDLEHAREQVAIAIEARRIGSGTEEAARVHEFLHFLLDRSGNDVVRGLALTYDPHMQRLLGAVPGHTTDAVMRERGDAVLTALAVGGAELVGQTVTGYYLAFGAQVVDSAVARGLTV